jgi:hypothetical protein
MKQTVQVLERVFFVVDEVNTKSHSPLFWHQDEDGMNLLGPCIHFLLSMPRLSENADAALRLDDLIREMVRLVCLCLMSRLKAMFSFNVPEQTQLESRFSRFIASYARYIGGPYRDLKVWALVTVSLLQDEGSRNLYLHEIRQDMASTGEADATVCVEIAKGFIWCDILKQAGVDKLTQDIASHSAGPAG